MDRLRRDLAPISSRAWEEIEFEATRTLRHFLTARPLIDVDEAKGWQHSARNSGRVEPIPAPQPGVLGQRRVVLPVAELRTPFEVPLAEVEAIDRGSPSPDLDAVIEAARRAAEAEDKAIYYGWPEAGIKGIVQEAVEPPLEISDDYEEYPSVVARAVAALRRSGIGGPYGIALGPRCYTGVIESTQHGGYPVLEHLRLILRGPVIWSPAVDGAVVVSLRGGDYAFDLGTDFSIGYTSHDDSTIRLYLEESFTFEVLEPRAAVSLVYPG